MLRWTGNWIPNSKMGKLRWTRNYATQWIHWEVLWNRQFSCNRGEILQESRIFFGHGIKNNRICYKLKILSALSVQIHEPFCNTNITHFSFSPLLPDVPSLRLFSFKLRPPFGPNLPVTVACKCQVLPFHMCHSPRHHHLTPWSLGFQVRPGTTLRQPSMIDTGCI